MNKLLGILFLLLTLTGCKGSNNSAGVTTADAVICLTQETKTCSAGNGIGVKTCNDAGTAWSSCSLTTCNAGYVLYNATCQATTRSCNVANGSGVENFNPSLGIYGSCVVNFCNSSFHVSSTATACENDSRNCSINELPINSKTGTALWNGFTRSWQACSITSCNTGYTLSNNTCIVSDTTPVDIPCSEGFTKFAGVCFQNSVGCSVPNGSGTQTFNSASGTYGSCVASSCTSNHHLIAGLCESNSRACLANELPSNASVGTMSWDIDGAKWNACVPTSCQSTYHVSSDNMCVSNVRTCSDSELPPNATTATSSWNSDIKAWNNCLATSCDATHHLLANSCVNNERACSSAELTSQAVAGTSAWDSLTNSWKTCQISQCNSTYHVSNNACISDIRTCTSAELPVNATSALSAWNGTAWGQCVASTCSTNYHLDNNKMCVSDSRSCSTMELPVNAISGITSWNVALSTWNSCMISTCGPTYHVSPMENVCADDTRACAAGELKAGYLAGSITWDHANAKWGSCVASSCDNGYHISGSTCAENTRSCSAAELPPNGFEGTVPWDQVNQTWGMCLVSKCNPEYHVSNNACISSNRACPAGDIPNNATAGTQSWNETNNAWNLCKITTCNATHHLDGANNLCIDNIRACPAGSLPTNSTAGTQEWNSALNDWKACVPTTCSATNHIEGGACVSDARACYAAELPTNATSGTTQWLGSSWATCTPTNCSGNNHVSASENACVTNYRACSTLELPPNSTSGTISWNTTTQTWNACVATNCDATHHVDISTNLCVDNARSCQGTEFPANATVGTTNWNYATLNWDPCQISSCVAGMHVTGNLCVSDVRSCPAADLPEFAATGNQNWTGSTWGACSVLTCQASFHINAGSCVSDSRSCPVMELPANSTSGTQTWNITGSSWNTCVASSCSTGYTASAGLCKDLTAPTLPTILLSSTTSDSLTSSPTVTITPGSDSGSGVARTEYTVVDESSNIIKDWSTFSTGNSASTAGINLTLQSGKTYTIRARSIDVAGNVSSPAAANWTVRLSCVPSDPYANQVVCSAYDLMALLSNAQKANLIIPLTKANATKWSNLTSASIRNGLVFSSLTGVQLTAVQQMITTAYVGGTGATILSEIRKSDAYLGSLNSTKGWGLNNYYISFVGTPSVTQPWILQINGHNVGYNLTFNNGVVSATPMFMSADPTNWSCTAAMVTSVPDACANTGAHAPLEAQRAGMEAALSGLFSYSAAKISSILSDVYAGVDPITTHDTNYPIAYPSTARGVLYTALTTTQKESVLLAIKAWTNTQAPAVGDQLYSDYTSPTALSQTYIAYIIGPLGVANFSANPTSIATRGSYLRIDGPRVWIEFMTPVSEQLSTTRLRYNSIWRDKLRDYGTQF